MQKIEITGTVTSVGKTEKVKVGKGNKDIKEVLNFSVTTEGKKGDTVYRVALWDKKIEQYKRFASKGKRVFVTGELSIEEYVKDGTKKTALNILPELIMAVVGEGAALLANQEYEVAPDDLGEPTATYVVEYEGGTDNG
jgi:hypothetical protein